MTEEGLDRDQLVLPILSRGLGSQQALDLTVDALNLHDCSSSLRMSAIVSSAHAIAAASASVRAFFAKFPLPAQLQSRGLQSKFRFASFIPADRLMCTRLRVV